uniref:MMS19 nucleotide excision repair protein n=1 Tax=Trichuris muris TaxID=70415 RepID=A0A5S6QSH4_TRIMR
MASGDAVLSADDYISLITSNRMNLLEFVKNHKCFMTHEDASIRSNAFELLASVITRLPSVYFSDLEAEEIGKYCSSVFLLQHNGSKPLLAALHYVVTHFSISLETLRNIIVSLLKKRIVISSLQLERSRIYAIILEYLNRSQAGSDESEIASDLLKSADGEVDPRCLIILFQICEVLAEKFELGPMNAELHEFVVSYFPVTFNASSHNPCGITCENLETSLNRCLTASDWLAEYTFGDVGKLLASSYGSKEKSSCAKLLSAALDRFSRKAILPHAGKLCRLLTPLILEPASAEVQNSEWFSVYNRLVKIVFRHECKLRTENEAWRVFAQFITDDLQTFYCHPEIGAHHGTHQMLLSAADQTAAGFWFLFTWATNKIFENFQMMESSREDYATLLLDWCRKLKGWGRTAIEDVEVVRMVKMFAMENLLASNEPALNDVGVAILVALAFSCFELIGESDVTTISMKLMHLLSSENLRHSSNCFDWYGLVATRCWPYFEKAVYPLLSEKFDTDLVELHAVPPMMAGCEEAMHFVLQLLTLRLQSATSEMECVIVLPALWRALKAMNFNCESGFRRFCRMILSFAVLNFDRPLLNGNGELKASTSLPDAYGKFLQDVFMAAPTNLSQWFLNEVIALAADREDTFFQSSLCLLLFVPVLCAATAADIVEHEKFLLTLWKMEPCRTQPTECKEWCRCSTLFSCLAHNVDNGPLLDQILDHWANRSEELFGQCQKCYANMGYLARALLLRNHPVGVSLLQNFFNHLRLMDGNAAIEALRLVYTLPSAAEKNECYRRLAPFHKERIAGYSVLLLRRLFQETKAHPNEELLRRACEVFALLWSYAPTTVPLTDFQFVLPMLTALRSCRQSVQNVAVQFFDSLLTTEGPLWDDEARLAEICEALLSCCSGNPNVLFCSCVFACLQLQIVERDASILGSQKALCSPSSRRSRQRMVYAGQANALRILQASFPKSSCYWILHSRCISQLQLGQRSLPSIVHVCADKSEKLPIVFLKSEGNVNL